MLCARGTSLQPYTTSSAAPLHTHGTMRLQYIDIAKGIAILAVIVGHVAIRLAPLSYGAQTMVAACFTFHMPLFFLLSGYFLHCSEPFRFRKEARHLLVPYLAGAALVVVLQVMTALLLHDLPSGISIPSLAAEWLNAAIYGSAAITGRELWPQAFRIGGLWFLLALFWAHLLVIASYKTRHPGIIVVAAACAGSLSARFVWLPLSIQAGMTASVYVYLGTVARKHDAASYLSRHPVLVLPACLIWLYAIMRFNGFGMGSADFGQTPSDIARNFIGSFGGMVSILYISLFIEQHTHNAAPKLARLGMLSLLILVIHIVDDDVTRIDAVNGYLLGIGLGAFKLVIIESIVRCSYTVLLARIASCFQPIRRLFSLR